MIKAPLNLTRHDTTPIITTPLTETLVDRLQTLQKKYGAGYAPITAHGFFYVYRKGAALIRAYTSLIMVGYFRGAASVFAASEPLILSRRPRFQALVGGYSIFKTGITMSQNQSASNPQTKTVSCLFSVFHHRKLIAQNITGLLALRFKRRYPAIVVKFAQMEVSHG